MDRTEINVGSRKSALALIQTHYVISTLQEMNTDLRFFVKKRETTGDKIMDVALSKIGNKGLFTQELEQDLISNKIDFAVHSLKDLPCDLPDGLTIGCILKRNNPQDALIIRPDLFNRGLRSLDDLMSKAPFPIVIGTSSLRRQAQLKSIYPNIQFYDIRGNIDTRIKKLDSSGSNGPLDPFPPLAAIMLAVAGMERQGAKYVDRISQIFPSQHIYYAVGQGALAVECRKDDEQLLRMLESINHKDTQLSCTAERSLMRALNGGCHVPIGVHSEVHDNLLSLYAKVLSPNGSTCISSMITGHIEEAHQLGLQLAHQLLQNGADKTLSQPPDPNPT